MQKPFTTQRTAFVKSPQTKIVKIGELADFQPIRPRRAKHLQQIVFARADFVIRASTFFRHSEFVICHWHPLPLFR
jgi:hypothetical protein